MQAGPSAISIKTHKRLKGTIFVNGITRNNLKIFETDSLRFFSPLNAGNQVSFLMFFFSRCELSFCFLFIQLSQHTIRFVHILNHVGHTWTIQAYSLLSPFWNRFGYTNVDSLLSISWNQCLVHLTHSNTHPLLSTISNRVRYTWTIEHTPSLVYILKSCSVHLNHSTYTLFCPHSHIVFGTLEPFNIQPLLSTFSNRVRYTWTIQTYTVSCPHSQIVFGTLEPFKHTLSLVQILKSCWVHLHHSNIHHLLSTFSNCVGYTWTIQTYTLRNQIVQILTVQTCTLPHHWVHFIRSAHSQYRLSKAVFGPFQLFNYIQTLKLCWIQVQSLLAKTAPTSLSIGNKTAQSIKRPWISASQKLNLPTLSLSHCNHHHLIIYSLTTRVFGAP